MNKTISDKLTLWNAKIELLTLEESIQFVIENIEGKKVFSTSFGIEDQVLTHALYPSYASFSTFTLDTGRQFEETYTVFHETTKKYPNYTIKTYFPDETDIQDYVSNQGINGFYSSVENRKKCCFIRKVKPLKRALKGANLWITGLRAEQSQNRETMQFLEWDDENELIKFNPLLKFSLEETELFAKKNAVPLNSLYHKGFLSIGCSPCTRAITRDEDFRAGRWSWENGKKECGLHITIEKNN